MYPIYNSPKRETTQMSINSKLNHQLKYIHTCSNTLNENKKATTITNNVDKSYKCNSE